MEARKSKIEFLRVGGTEEPRLHTDDQPRVSNLHLYASLSFLHTTPTSEEVHESYIGFLVIRC